MWVLEWGKALAMRASGVHLGVLRDSLGVWARGIVGVGLYVVRGGGKERYLHVGEAMAGGG